MSGSLTNRTEFTTSFLKMFFREPPAAGWMAELRGEIERTPAAAAFTLATVASLRDHRPALAALDRPVLFVHESMLATEAQGVRQVLPAAEVVAMENVGHALFVERPAEFHRIVDTFLGLVGGWGRVRPMNAPSADGGTSSSSSSPCWHRRRPRHWGIGGCDGGGFCDDALDGGGAGEWRGDGGGAGGFGGVVPGVLAAAVCLRPEAREFTARFAGFDAGFLRAVVGRDGLAGLDPGKGRFRSFLLAAMKNFLANEGDRARALKRGGGVVVVSFDSMDSEVGVEAGLAAGGLDAEQAYDRQWALAVLDRVLERLREESRAAGKGAQFEALKETLTGERGALPYTAIGLRLGMTEAAKVAVHRLRQRIVSRSRCKWPGRFPSRGWWWRNCGSYGRRSGRESRRKRVRDVVTLRGDCFFMG